MNALYVNLLLLLALIVALVAWWAANQGGYRGKIAARVRQAGSVSAQTESGKEESKDANFFAPMLEKLARFGERMPLFTPNHRLKLANDLLKAGFRSLSAVSILIGVKFVAGLICWGSQLNPTLAAVSVIVFIVVTAMLLVAERFRSSS